ncbi:4-hydroxybenzoate octaprenyltransferase [Thermosulfidibacter takaii ABI70S6]|uniref:4-hydroxybenzoate polyprenyltransferase n=1 Tax=Thermosulfidibacter takaii (strain DSM 17441 / JCM 13301 / NBRC 103674 / ABI70S6) TaxID=1298851 RepID=A0A0S3QTL9_THET7|nr:UbiA-like polyprenyltransferase [Thermosulfidibacter takaii]BAT71682.1 4-hydroxybenzoate octaprenyltransferase [Thermosulfidibacter takaii ABI70S6]
MLRIVEQVKKILEMIKFPHTVFALPFALTSAVIAAKGIPDGHTLFWILVAMVGARSGAMAFNRWADAEIDALNPRTKDRHIPKGEIKKEQALTFCIVSYALLVIAAYNLNPLCFYLSPIAIIVTAGYSYTKRFTWASHLILGLSLAMAPIGAWIAVTGRIDLPAVLLGAAVLFWVAGFDILYALQDIDFDRQYGLYSIPRFLGVKWSLWVARLFHVITICFLVWVRESASYLDGFFTLGIVVAACLLFYEHLLVKPDDLSKLDVAFFNMNGYLSLEIFLFTLIDLLV